MNAPDKIFITEYNASVKTGYFSHDKDDMFNQEYIRKSALLEWADGMKEGWGDIGQKGVILVLDELIDKINSL